MADNNLARSRNDVPDFFADGDPLAELARIVGYEERAVAKPEPFAASASPVGSGRTDPVFNLEDELLREFERYDTPRLDPVDDVGMGEPLAAPSPAAAFNRDASPDPVFEAPQPFPNFDDRGDSSLEHHSAVAADSWSAEAVDASAADPYQDHTNDSHFGILPSQGSGFIEPEAELPVELPYASSDWAADRSDQVVAEPVTHEPDLDFGALDLAEELETSIVASPVVQPSQNAPRKPGFTPSFRMPLANFQSGAGVVSERPAEPKVEPPVAAAQPSVVAKKSEEPLFQGWNVSPTPAAPVVTAATAPEITPLAMSPMNIPLAGPVESVTAKPSAAFNPQPKVQGDQFSALDEILYDVGRYSKTETRDPAPAAVPVAAETIAVPAAKPAPTTPIAAAAPVVSPNDDVDPFADVEFELALDDLELDLADMLVEENTKRVEPVREATQPPASVAPIPAAPIAAAPAVVAASAMAAPVFAATSPATPVAATAVEAKVEQDDDIAFDPALIAESEEQPEAIAELDVPALPVAEPEEQPLYRNDYDLDIDAELASLLEAPETVASMRGDEVLPPQPAAAVAQGTAPAGKSVYSDLDEFERALEEDFRRSLATPLQPDERYAPADAYTRDVDEERASNPVKRWIAPLAAVGILAVCGAGAYAWLGNSVPGAGGNGEPMVIAADNDPVKVAPENPGGKTVPNQDKAVYDRVAGAASQTPRQQQLISSSEEPVDVVQKTLMPENLPLEGETDVQMTEVSDTEDPRLLPQDQAGAPQAADQQPVTVMPRKVKTMIVRADGKLVEQETIVPVASASETKVAAASAKSDAPGAIAQSAAPFPTAGQAAPAPTSGVVPVSAPADMASAAPAIPAAAQAPAAIEQLAEPAAASNVRAPVPTARPSQQPTNVVASVSDQGNVRPAAAAPVSAPAAAAPAAQNTQVASLGAGGYVIQIASLPSQADAQKSYQNLSNKFGSVIGGRGVDIKAAEIAGKGTFYRVRIPAGNKTEAVALCERYRSAGGSCLVAR